MTRGVKFWTKDRIAFIKEHFVAASVPTWAARTESPEGEFLRGAGIDKMWVTSSGYMSCLSASGKYLGRRPDDKVIEKFKALPESERAAGAVEVRDLNPSERIIPAPPEGGLVFRVHARFLVRGDDGKLRAAKTPDFPLMRAKPRVLQSWKLFLQPNTEYMWLTKAEAESMVPADPAPGRKVDVDPVVVQRMARFHLTPKRATTSEGGIVHKRLLKKAEMALVVEDVSAERIRMRIEGFIHWGSDFDAEKATSPNGPLKMGYDAKLQGRAEYDRARKAFTRFDILVPGEVWGRWGDANNKSMYVERPGRAPFGFALELAGDSPTDRIPPGGNGKYVAPRTGYWGTAGSR